MIVTIHVCLVHGEQEVTREWLPNYCQVVIAKHALHNDICGRPLYEKKEVR